MWSSGCGELLSSDDPRLSGSSVALENGPTEPLEGDPTLKRVPMDGPGFFIPPPIFPNDMNASVADDVRATEQPDGSELVDVNADPEIEWLAGGISYPTPDELDLMQQANQLVPADEAAAGELPLYVDNSTLPFFRPVFNQKHGSCAQASGVAYIFTYEINRLRGLHSDNVATQYPSHFTYNFLNRGDGAKGSWMMNGWQIIKEMGVPNIATYGGISSTATRWMTGYDNYESAMKNRVASWEAIKLYTSGFVSNLDAVKLWLHNRGTEGATGGLASFAVNIRGAQYEQLPEGTPHAGSAVLPHFGYEGGHAMTVVGYNDEVRYDYNGDGKYTNDIDINDDGIVNMMDWEVGALIIVNSWGPAWGNQGKAFVPYRAAAEAFWGGTLWVVNAVETYEPKETMRLKMEHPSRDALTIRAGSTDDLRSFTALQRRGGPFSVLGDSDGAIEIALDISNHETDQAGTFPYSVVVTEADQAGLYDGEIQDVALTRYRDYPHTDEEYVTPLALSRELDNDAATALQVLEEDKIPLDGQALCGVWQTETPSCSSRESYFRERFLHCYEDKDFCDRSYASCENFCSGWMGCRGSLDINGGDPLVASATCDASAMP